MSAVTTREGGCWPDATQLLLLRAALCRGEAGVAAWQAWRERANIEDVDYASYRLLPLVARRLSAEGVDDPTLKTCKGIYKHTFSRNHLLFNRVKPVVMALQEAGIPTLLLKGGALALGIYRDLGVRPMIDLDVMVPTAQAARAREIVTGLGWAPTYYTPESYLPFVHALSYGNGGPRDLDLHWHALWECCADGADDELWARAEPISAPGFKALMLEPTDQLLQVCAHGLRWSAVPTVHWLADIVTILATRGDAVDWPRLVAQARDRRLAVQVREALTFARDELGAGVPDEVVTELRAVRPSRAERIEYWARSRPPSLTRGALLHIFDYERLCGDAPVWRVVIGFPVHIRTIWGLDHVWQLPACAARKVLGRMRERPGEVER